MGTKLCTKCNLEKDLESFSTKGKGKFASRCKECLAQIKREKYISHKKIDLSTAQRNTKQCSICLIEKDISCFYRNYNCNTYRNECKDCNNKRIRSKKLEIKQVIEQLKSEPCTDCGNRFPYYVMDFDHIDGTTKTFNVSEMRAYSLDNILKEVSKCELVCANCHRIRTFSRQSAKK